MKPLWWEVSICEQLAEEEFTIAPCSSLETKPGSLKHDAALTGQVVDSRMAVFGSATEQVEFSSLIVKWNLFLLLCTLEGELLLMQSVAGVSWELSSKISYINFWIWTRFKEASAGWNQLLVNWKLNNEFISFQHRIWVTIPNKPKIDKWNF